MIATPSVLARIARSISATGREPGRRSVRAALAAHNMTATDDALDAALAGELEAGGWIAEPPRYAPRSRRRYQVPASAYATRDGERRSA